MATESDEILMSVEYFQQSGIFSAEDLRWSMEDQLNSATRIALGITTNPDLSWNRFLAMEPDWQKMVVVYQSHSRREMRQLSEEMDGDGWCLLRDFDVQSDSVTNADKALYYLCLLIRQ